MKFLRYILFPFSLIYGIIVTIRNFFFDVGILPSKRFPIWVISIGNLSVGGTGKSPHAEYVVRLLEKLTNSYENLELTFDKIGIVSRGYGRVNKGFLLANNSSNAKEIGDEPLQLKRRLKEVYIGVDGNRVRGIRMLLTLNPQIRAIVLDDAFQHRYVKRDLSILLTSYDKPYYDDQVLPAGRLREPRNGYKRAQIIIVTNTPVNITDIEKKIILKKINPASRQKVFFSSVIYHSLTSVFKGDIPLPEINKNYSVVLLTGIANPHNLYNHLAEVARDVVHISFPDHHAFSSSDIAKVVKAYNAVSNPNRIIVTTEKDAMRLLVGTLGKDFGDIPVFYLPIRVKVNEENIFEDTIVEHLNPLVPAKPIRKLDK